MELPPTWLSEEHRERVPSRVLQGFLHTADSTASRSLRAASEGGGWEVGGGVGECQVTSAICNVC